MIRSIIYRSDYGSTRRYAELLSKAVGVPALPLQGAAAPDGESFYMGCVMDGRIRGYRCAAARLRIAGVCAVGLEEAGEDTAFKIRRNTGVNDSRIRVFYARGAFDKDKLSPIHRLMLKGAMDGAAASAGAAAMLELMQKGCDFVSEENIRPAAEWIIWRDRAERQKQMGMP